MTRRTYWAFTPRFVVLLCAAFIGDGSLCWAEQSTHPDPGFLVHRNRLEDVDQSNGATHRIHLADSVSIGSESGSLSTLFGRIVGAKLLHPGVLVLDGSYGELRLYDHSGQHLATAGAMGSGPGEIRDAVGLEVDRESASIFVIESGGTIEVYELVMTADQYSIRYRQSISIDLDGIYSGCLMGNDFVLNSTSAESPAMLHRVERDSGRILQSFGAFYESSNEFLNRRVSRGALACDPDTNTVWFGSHFTPNLYVFGPDGNLERALRLTEGLSQAVSVDRSGTLTYSSPNPSYHITSLVHAPSHGGVFVEIDGFRTETNGDSRPAHVTINSKSWIISSTKGIDRTQMIRGKVQDMSDSTLLVSESRPFPRIVIYRVSESLDAR